MDDGEVVVARAGCRLGQQHDVAQFHAGQRQTALAVVHLSAREGSVERLGFGHHPGAERLGGPGRVVVGGDACGIAVFLEICLGSVGIAVENGALPLDEGGKPFR